MQAVAATPEKPHQRQRGAALCLPVLPFTRAAARATRNTRNAYTHASAQAQARTAQHARRTDGQGATRRQTAANGANSRFMVKVGKCIDRAAVVKNRGIIRRQKGKRGNTRAHTRAKGARQAAKGGARCTTRRRLNGNTLLDGGKGGKKRRRRQSR